MKQIKAKTPTKQIKNWFDTVHPSPSAKDTHHQVAEHLTIALGFLLSCQEIGTSAVAREELGFAVNVIDFIQRRIRTSSEGIELEFSDLDREMMMKSLCAQIRSCVGLAHMFEMDLEGALQEMADSDDTRLGSDRQPIFNERHAIIDGIGYRKPNYIQFI